MIVELIANHYHGKPVKKTPIWIWWSYHLFVNNFEKFQKRTCWLVDWFLHATFALINSIPVNVLFNWFQRWTLLGTSRGCPFVLCIFPFLLICFRRCFFVELSQGFLYQEDCGRCCHIGCVSLSQTHHRAIVGLQIQRVSGWRSFLFFLSEGWSCLFGTANNYLKVWSKWSPMRKVCTVYLL